MSYRRSDRNHPSSSALSSSLPSSSSSPPSSSLSLPLPLSGVNVQSITSLSTNNDNNNNVNVNISNNSQQALVEEKFNLENKPEGDNEDDIDEQSDHRNEVCHHSQAYFMFVAKHNKVKFKVQEKCTTCGNELGKHTMISVNDNEMLLKNVFGDNFIVKSQSNSEVKQNDNNHFYANNTTGNQQSAIRECSKQQSINGSFTPQKDLPQIFLMNYEVEMSILAYGDHEVWKKVLPSVMKLEDKSEKTWIADNISNVANLTWEQSKMLFCQHWYRPNHKELLSNLFNDCRQKSNQSVSDFINEFRRNMQINSYVEDDRICLDFKNKLSNHIQRAIDMQWTSRYGIGTPYKLDKLMELANIIDVSYTSHSSSGHSPSHSSVSSHIVVKRKNSFVNRNNSSFPSLSSGVLQCVHHPDSHSHNTDDCRSNPNKKIKSTSAFPPRSSSSFHTNNMKKNTSSSFSSLQVKSDNNGGKTLLTPTSAAWRCKVCNKSAPGHTPQLCPENKFSKNNVREEKKQ